MALALVPVLGAGAAALRHGVQTLGAALPAALAWWSPQWIAPFRRQLTGGWQNGAAPFPSASLLRPQLQLRVGLHPPSQDCPLAQASCQWTLPARPCCPAAHSWWGQA
mmetsp:Transcript_37586/g.106154  ORF Transcript_37586/g.106154 Transcript_37586/m.106154 type:complete len:108 (+) Transcript_37586:1222-1545(+)